LVDKNSKKFVLIDGSSYLYRAFYAMPHLKNSKDEHTGALFGVCNMVYRLLNKYNPGLFMYDF
jgi:5''-3'' exonuclease (including N-terminal domain of PolI)